MALKIHGTDNIQAGTVQTQILASGVGGGPKITSIVVTDSSYTNIDDTAVGLSGGYIKITGTGFVSGCSIIVGTTVATSVSFINSTEVRAQVPAQSAGTYTVYVTNTDGGVAIRVNGLNYSSTPTWTTTSPLGDGAIDTAISVQLAATSNSAVTYALQAGSTLPAGLSLSSGGLLTGTVTSITVDTTYNFTVVATDQENQDTPQAFSITISVNDPNFKNTVLLLQADTAPTIISDASSNNFDLTVSGDARASSFTPYGTGWSVYFDGSGDYLSTAANSAFVFGTGDFCIEGYFYVTADSTSAVATIVANTAGGNSGWIFSYYTGGFRFQATGMQIFQVSSSLNAWHHVVICRAAGTTSMFIDGARQGTTSGAYTWSDNSTLNIGYRGSDNYFTGYMSGVRLVKGSSVYDPTQTTITVPTAPLTAITNTSLLTCNANRFLDSSSNGFAITRNGDAKIVSFNPFGITNTGVNGSAYFDGTGDYITTNITTLSGEFTVEFWFYRLSSGNNVMFTIGDSFTDTGAEVYIGSSGTLLQYYSNNLTRISSTAPNIGSWSYIAVTRDASNVVRLYVNGVQVGSNYTHAATLGTVLRIGAEYYNGSISSTVANGYISDFRISNIARTISVPTQPLTAIANTQLLTLQYDQPHNNHTFLDASSNQFVITRAGNATQGTFSPFSQTGNSVYFDGTGDYLSIAGNTDFNLSGSDFTLEGWVNLSGYKASDSVIGIISNTAADSLNGFYFFISGNSTSWSTCGFNAKSSNTFTVGVGVAYTFSLGTWYHMAISKSGTTYRIFANGVLLTTQTNSSTWTDTNNINVGTINAATGITLGYLSNVRLIKGTALYTTNFTPSTTPLTAIANTKLLTCHDNRFRDGSTNNFTVTRNGDAKVTSFGPFSTTSYTPALHGGSAYFDGSGDYLLAPYNDAFDYRTSDFTIELWLYPLSHPAQAGIWIQSPNASAFGPIWLWLASGVITLAATTADGTFNIVNSVSVSGTIPLNSWTHFALTRTSGVWRSFVNGAQFWTITNSGSLFVLNTSIGIGGWVDNTRHFNGYFSGYRALKGVSAYTSNFTPPTAPASPTAATSLLLNFTDAAIRDGRGISVLETLGDTKTSTVQTKYGTGSMRFDGTGDYLVPYNVNTNTYAFGSGDFTIEFWVRFGALAGNQMIYDSRPSATDGLYPMIYASGTSLRYYVNAVDRITSGTISTNTWYHVAVARSATSTKMFIDGTQAGSTYTDSTVYINATNRPLIAQNGTNLGAALNGYIDDLRVTTGIARYTANFTPPAAKFLAR